MPPSEIQAPRSSLADRYRVLLEIGRTLTGTLSTDDLFRSIYRETARVLEAAGFYISLYDRERDLATVVFYADKGEERRADITYRGTDSEVIRTGRACMVEDRSRIDSLLVLGEDDTDVTRSAISAPLRHKGEVIGAISTQSYRSASYGSEDLELLQGIADVAAVAVENARYVTELHRRRREAERIEEIGRAVAGSLDTGEVLRKVIDSAIELLELDGSTVWLLDEEEERVVRVGASAGEIQMPEGISWRLDTAIYERLVEDRKPVLIEDLEESDLIPEKMRDYIQAGTGVAVPIVVAGEVVGALSAGSRETRAFEEDDVAALARLTSQASVALENARLHADVQALSLTDPLTGLPNRRHLEMHLSREFAAARRGRSLGAVIFDLDNFKQYNDTLGHVAGDRILRAFGRILDGEARSMNLVARYGGDEFVSILSEIEPGGAEIHAGRVEERVTQDEELAPHNITVSYGVALFTPEMDGPGDLIRAADRDLYRTKGSRGSGRADPPPA